MRVPSLRPVFRFHFALLLLAGALWLLWPRAAHAQEIWHVDDSTPDGLVAHWKFDEPGASPVLPYVGTVTGTLQNGASMAAGPVPPVLSFTNTGVLALDGTNDRVELADNAALNLATNFTVAGWVQRDTTGAYHAIYDSGEQANTWWIFIADGAAGKDNKLGFGERGIAEVYSTQAITDTNYHHIAVTKAGNSGQNLTFYVDGVARGTAAVGSVTLPSGVKHIGGLQDGGAFAHFDGRIDDLRLYNRALSAAEVLRLAQGKGCVSDGQTWDTAFRDLHCALAAAAAGDDIWIGAGTYKPGTSPFVPYQLKNGVDILGGFTGTAGIKETSPTQRPAFNPNAPLTILSGDILGNDAAVPFGAAGLYTDNANTVLFAPTGAVVSIDGLRVQGGNARTGTGDGTRGGGLRALIGASVALTNVHFFGNQATGNGGAIFSRAPLTLVGGTFERNSAASNGGALLITSTLAISSSFFLTNTAAGSGGGVAAAGPATIVGSTFRGNAATAFYGGAIAAQGQLTVRGSIFIANQAGFFGGAINTDLLPALVEFSTFERNRVFSFRGGGINADGPLTVRGGAFFTNTAPFGGGAIQTSFQFGTVVESSQFRANSATGANCTPACSHGDGGAINAGAPLTVTGSVFLSNTARLDGGAIAGSADVTLRGSTLTGNRAGFPTQAANPGDGGALWVAGLLDAEDTTAQGNSATRQGGGLFADGSLLKLVAVDVIGNSAPKGGGLAVSLPLDATLQTTLSIAGSLFEDNRATTGSGGGIQTGMPLQIADTDFRNNIAQVSGGAIDAPPAEAVAAAVEAAAARDETLVLAADVLPLQPLLVIEGGSFAGNAATTGFGGGIRAQMSAQISGTLFLSNTAQVDGGGIVSSAPLTLTNSQFVGNRAVTRDGGGVSASLILDGAPATVSSGNLYQSNVAGRSGGGLRMSGSSTGDRFLDNRAASEAAGLQARGTTTVTHGIFLRNRGFLSAAIAAAGSSSVFPPTAALTVVNSLFAGNTITSTSVNVATDLRLFDLNAALLHNTFADPDPASNTKATAALVRGSLDARNNIFANYAVAVRVIQSATVTLDTNVLFNTLPAALGPITATNTITGNPAFANAAAFDYHIGPASLARNMGLNLGIATDFEGDPRPIGPAPDIGFDEARFLAPTAVAGGPYSGNEGAPVALDATGSSDDGALVSFAWDCTNDGSFDVTRATPTGASCTYADNGAFTVRLRVTDNTGENGEATAPVTISNVTPAVTPASAQSVLSGTAQSFAIGSFADPGTDAPWQVTINWGDSTPATVFDLGVTGAIPSQSHTYSTPGQRTVTVQVRDKDNATGSATFIITVAGPGDPPPDGEEIQYLPVIQN